MEPPALAKPPAAPGLSPTKTIVRSQLCIQSKHTWAKKKEKKTLPFSPLEVRNLDSRLWNTAAFP